MTKAHSRYSEIVASVTRDMRLQAWGEDHFSSPESRALYFKDTLVVAFDRQFDSGLYNLKYHLLEHMVGDVQRFEALYVLGSGL